MKLAQNVALLPISIEGMGSLNLVLAWDDKNLVLIDAGLPGQTDEIVKAIEGGGFQAENLTHIIITHQDWDHIGCVRELQKIAPNLRVVAHVDEAPYIDGRTMPIKLAARLTQYDTMTEEQRAGINRWKDMHESAPITVHEQAQDGQVLPVCGGIEIVHVPGHTPGHIAVYFKESRIIVVGDAANIKDDKVAGSNPIHTHDIAQAEESLEKIKGYELNGIVAYHTGYLPL
jgi:glyoxylase-like metal-dependent hydrolase (beta-lactamase superfamily II)